MKHIQYLLVALIVMMVGCKSVPSERVPEADQGSWLSAEQMAELMRDGVVHDSQGNRYNLHPLPGYVPPARKAGEAYEEAGDALVELATGDHWVDPLEDVGEFYEDMYVDVWGRSGWVASGMEAGFEDIAWEWGIKGCGKVWDKNMTRAGEVVDSRSFGWSLAYPWAVVSSTLDTVVRVPVGVAGGTALAGLGLGTGAAATAIGTAGGVVYVPLAWSGPVVRGAYYVIVPGVLEPVIVWTWHSAMGPVLCVASDKPNLEMVHPFWVSVTSPQGKLLTVNPRVDGHLHAPYQAQQVKALVVDYVQLDATQKTRYQDLKEEQRAERLQLEEQQRKQRNQLSAQEDNQRKRMLNQMALKELAEVLTTAGMSHQMTVYQLGYWLRTELGISQPASLDLASAVWHLLPETPRISSVETTGDGEVDNAKLPHERAQDTLQE